MKHYQNRNFSIPPISFVLFHLLNEFLLNFVLICRVLQQWIFSEKQNPLRLNISLVLVIMRSSDICQLQRSQKKSNYKRERLIQECLICLKTYSETTALTMRRLFSQTHLCCGLVWPHRLCVS